MDVLQDMIDVDSDAGPMAVLHTRPATGPSRRVGIFFDAPGIRDVTHTFCQKLAAEGYDVVVPDLYHRHQRLFHATTAMADADPTLRPRMGELMATLVDAEIQQDMADAMAGVGWDDSPVGCIGFCLGARAVHRAMTGRPATFVAGSMFHPSFLADDKDDSPHLSVGELTGGLHIGIGTADEIQSIAMHQRYFDGIASMPNVELTIFDGADHGFTWPGGANHHAEASTTCFAKTMALFDERL